MGLTFEINGPLPEHAIRHVIREAEARMADGVDAKQALVTAAQEYLAEQRVRVLRGGIDSAVEMAEMIGAEVDWPAALPEVVAQIGAEAFGKVLDEYAGGPAQQLAAALAKAAVEAKPVLPMNRGKWLSKLGIVKAHIDALVPATTAPGTHGSPELDADAAKLIALGADPGPTIQELDGDLAAMLGLDTTEAQPVIAAPPPFEQFQAAFAAGADPLPPTSADAPSAALPGPDAPPPPAPTNPRDAFVLLGEATDLDAGALAERMGISRSTAHNYLTGKTAKVRVTIQQARIAVSEIDVRVAKLRRAAEIFSQVRD